MKFLLLLLLSLTSLTPTLASSPDTLYYDAYWNLCQPYKALFYRVASVEKKEILFEGPVKDYTKANHRLIMEGSYKKGKKNGLFTFYHLNGQQESSGEYHENYRTGQWKTYHQNGKLHKLTEYLGDNKNSHLLVELWDSLGNNLVEKGTGVWQEINRNAVNNRIIVIVGKVENGRRVDKWQVNYANRELFLEENYVNGEFSFGDLWEKGSKKPYFQSKLLADEYAEISKPELFAYDEKALDKNFYGEGLYYFLNLYLGIPYHVQAEKEYFNVNTSSVKCRAENFVPAIYSGGPLALYRYLTQLKAEFAAPDDEKGMVIINLRINKYGSVRDYFVSRGISTTQNKKAIEKVKKLKWIPAYCSASTINSYTRIAIYY